MSTITFCCSEKDKDALKAGVLEILRNHYFITVHPNTNAKYENEGEEVYRERLNQLMKNKLCQFEETEEGVLVEFDSTEDAGFAIADEVYHTAMGYSDNGLTYIDPIFEAIVKAFPSVSFEADTECADNWVYEENHYSYDGETLTKDDEELDTSMESPVLQNEESSLSEEREVNIYELLLAKVFENTPDFEDDLQNKMKLAKQNHKRDPSFFEHPLYLLVGYLLNNAKMSDEKIIDMLNASGVSKNELDFILKNSCMLRF